MRDSSVLGWVVFMVLSIRSGAKEGSWVLVSWEAWLVGELSQRGELQNAVIRFGVQISLAVIAGFQRLLDAIAKRFCQACFPSRYPMHGIENLGPIDSFGGLVQRVAGIYSGGVQAQPR